MAQPQWHPSDEPINAAEPMVSMPHVVGGIRIAKIDAAFFYTPKGETKRVRFRVRERAQFRDAKVIAVCLGHCIRGELKPCQHVPEGVAAEGETGLDGLYRAHPTELELRKSREQHVFALFCADPLDPEGHAAQKTLHTERIAALKETKSALERQALINEWKMDPRFVQLACERVGLLSSELWGDSRVPLTM